MPDTYTPNLNLKKPGYDSPADIADINANMDKIDAHASQLSQQMANYRTAGNLLDNSDWRAKKNIVNQRGQDVYTQNDYTIDRWELWNGTVNVTDLGYISTTGQLYQKVDIPTDKTYTFAVMTGDGIAVAAGIPANFANATLGNTTIALTTINGYVEVVIQPTPGYDVAGAIWAALYEGEYTAETLPPYVPKGYAVELAECQRYYQRVDRTIAVGVSNNRGMAYIFIPLPQKLREVEVTIEDLGNLWAYTPTGNAAALTYTGCMRSYNGIRLHFSCSINTNYPISVPDIQFGVSADL